MSKEKEMGGGLEPYLLPQKVVPKGGEASK
jgi:hypothetical protein